MKHLSFIVSKQCASQDFEVNGHNVKVKGQAVKIAPQFVFAIHGMLIWPENIKQLPFVISE